MIPMGMELRALGVTNPIGFFLHIPVPPTQTFETSGQSASESQVSVLRGPPLHVPLHTRLPSATHVATFSQT